MISLSMIRTARDGRALPVSMSMADFDALLTVPTEHPTPRPKGTTWDEAIESAKGTLPAWSPAMYRDTAETRRIAANVEAVSCFVLDLDSGEPFDRAVQLVAPYYALSHTTWRHRPSKPKARIILPLLTPCPVERWAEVWSAGDRWAQGAGVHMDQACKDPCRLYFLPAVIAGSARSAEYYMAGKVDGERLSWRRLLIDNPAPERPRTFDPVRSIVLPGQSYEHSGEADIKRRRARGILNAACKDISNEVEGGRNNGVYRASARAGQLHAAGALALAEAEAAILSAALACGLDQREALTTIASGVRRGISDGPYNFAI
jgi:hypothetical protein